MTTLQSIDARTGQAFGPSFADSSTADIDAAVRAAHAAFADWQASEGSTRAALLEALALALEQDREALVALADQETGLGLPRLNG
ncbi:MAG: aldehyde dehydrogenase family protein, partial [Rhodoferax sp.]